MIEYVNDSLLNATEPVIAHGCNNQGVWKAGVFLALGERWPEVPRVYQFANASGAMGPGDVSWVKVAEQRHVANVITQQKYGRDPGTRYVSYDALDRGLRRVVSEGRQRGLTDVLAIPLIGAGLANGRWTIIRAIIEEIASDERVTFRIYVPDSAELRQAEEL